MDHMGDLGPHNFRPPEFNGPGLALYFLRRRHTFFRPRDRDRSFGGSDIFSISFGQTPVAARALNRRGRAGCSFYVIIPYPDFTQFSSEHLPVFLTCGALYFVAQFMQDRRLASLYFAAIMTGAIPFAKL